MTFLQVRGAIPTTPWELVLTSSRETQFVLAILAVFSVVAVLVLRMSATTWPWPPAPTTSTLTTEPSP